MLTLLTWCFVCFCCWVFCCCCLVGCLFLGKGCVCFNSPFAWKGTYQQNNDSQFFQDRSYKNPDKNSEAGFLYQALLCQALPNCLSEQNMKKRKKKARNSNNKVPKGSQNQPQSCDILKTDLAYNCNKWGRIGLIKGIRQLQG